MGASIFQRQAREFFTENLRNDSDLFAWIVRNGYMFIASTTRKIAKRFASKSPWTNAFNLTVANPDLIYVQGKAIRDGWLLSEDHAWTVTSDGVVVDPTLGKNGAYWWAGVPIKRDALIASVVSHSGMDFISNEKPHRRSEQWQKRSIMRLPIVDQLPSLEAVPLLELLRTKKMRTLYPEMCERLLNT